jgi:small ligand-binding sensory domain FIST
MLDDLNYNVILNVIEYLNVLDSGILAATSKRYLYLVCEYRRLRGPEIAVSSSWDASNCKHRSAKEVASAPIQLMQKPPNLVLSFSATRRDDDTSAKEFAMAVLGSMPSNAIILGATTGSILVNLGKKDEAFATEYTSTSSVMFASFPDAEIRPFALDGSQERSTRMVEQDFEIFADELAIAGDQHWKSIIVYATGTSAAMVDIFISAIQSKIPNTTIVGGACDGGFIHRYFLTREYLLTFPVKLLRRKITSLGGSNAQLKQCSEKTDLIDLALQLQTQSMVNPNAWIQIEGVKDAIFGVVFGGQVPVRSIVSRGVRSVTHGVPKNSSPYVVKDEEMGSNIGPPDLGFQNIKSAHCIFSLTNVETGETIHAMDLYNRAMNDKASFVGVKRSHEDGFELHLLDRDLCGLLGSVIVPTNGSHDQEDSLVGAEVDFFYMDGEACRVDMDHKVSVLREKTKGERILGALIFSCSGRGPLRGALVPSCTSTSKPLIDEDMEDASRFARVFPEVPCLGYFSGSEIGPLALVGGSNDSTKTAKQRSTAVVCLFIDPIAKRRVYNLDDTPEAVQTFIDQAMKSGLIGGHKRVVKKSEHPGNY